MSFSAVELIIKKREHEVLTTDEINWLVDAYTKGVVADEQMSAMAMAILLNGMERREILDLTMAMIASGERLDFSGLSKPTADKHSQRCAKSWPVTPDPAASDYTPRP